MKKICYVFLLIFLGTHSYSYATPAKQIIIQFPQELTAQDEAQFRNQLESLIEHKHIAVKHGSRWILSLSSKIPEKKFNDILAKLNAMKGVSFAEEDRMMKPLPVKSIVPTQ